MADSADQQQQQQYDPQNETAQAYCLVGVVIGIVVTALDAGPAGPLIILGSLLILVSTSAGMCRGLPPPQP